MKVGLASAAVLLFSWRQRAGDGADCAPGTREDAEFQKGNLDTSTAMGGQAQQRH